MHVKESVMMYLVRRGNPRNLPAKMIVTNIGNAEEDPPIGVDSLYRQMCVFSGF